MYWYIHIIGIGTSSFVLYREVFFAWSVLYRRFHCCSDPHMCILMYIIITAHIFTVGTQLSSEG